MVFGELGVLSFDACSFSPAVGLTMKLVGEPDAGNRHVRLCVQ